MILTCYKRCVCFFLVLTLMSCGSNLAPVAEIKWQPYSQNQKTHKVMRDETLYAIAFRYDTDFRTLARLNHVRPPYSLRVGQVLNLRASSPVAPVSRRSAVGLKSYKSPVLVRPQRAIYSPVKNNQGRKSSRWLWPVNGRVMTSFMPGQGKKGINIACKNGDNVVATSAGIVAYAGSGLRGYGNLIIIKHSSEYLAAYGNNARILVSEGQRVTAGQVIAKAGMIDHQHSGVHFEIRKAGVPVNPLKYLQKG